LGSVFFFLLNQAIYSKLMARILIVDDEDGVRAAVSRRLERAGHQVSVAGNVHEGTKAILEEDLYDVVVTDMSMDEPDSGLDIIKCAFSRDVFAEVIVMTAYGNVTNAVESMRRGAFDYIEKNAPGVDVYEEIVAKVDQAMLRRLRDMRTLEQWESKARPV
jgi:DNA-binding NtrC family response regulator